VAELEKYSWRTKLQNIHFFPDRIFLDVIYCSDLFLIWIPLAAEGYLISRVSALFFQDKINSSLSSIFHHCLLILAVAIRKIEKHIPNSANDTINC
jgi:hypothetical protein